MIFLSLFQLALVGSISYIVAHFYGVIQAEAFATGGLIASISLLYAYVLTKLVLTKKSVALSRGLVVLKYPIIGMILYFAAARFSTSIGWLSGGVATAALTGLATGFYFQRQANKPD